MVEQLVLFIALVSVRCGCSSGGRISKSLQGVDLTQIPCGLFGSKTGLLFRIHSLGVLAKPCLSELFQVAGASLQHGGRLMRSCDIVVSNALHSDSVLC